MFSIVAQEQQWYFQNCNNYIYRYQATTPHYGGLRVGIGGNEGEKGCVYFENQIKFISGCLTTENWWNNISREKRTWLYVIMFIALEKVYDKVLKCIITNQ